MSDEIGKPYPRRDGRTKVTGEAVYSYEWPVPGILYGVLVTSNLAKGRITSIDSAAAEKEPGVIAVLTPFNAMKLPGGAKPADTGDRIVQVLQDDQILYSNQPVALAVADTFERALHAAALVRVETGRGTTALNLTDLSVPLSMKLVTLHLADGSSVTLGIVLTIMRERMEKMVADFVQALETAPGS